MITTVLALEPLNALLTDFLVSFLVVIITVLTFDPLNAPGSIVSMFLPRVTVVALLFLNEPSFTVVTTHSLPLIFTVSLMVISSASVSSTYVK